MCFKAAGIYAFLVQLLPGRSLADGPETAQLFVMLSLLHLLNNGGGGEELPWNKNRGGLLGILPMQPNLRLGLQRFDPAQEQGLGYSFLVWLEDQPLRSQGLQLAWDHPEISGSLRSRCRYSQHGEGHDVPACHKGIPCEEALGNNARQP